MQRLRVLDRFWRRPPTREGRNEQTKALAAVFNAMSIAMAVAGLVGPTINPALESSLSPFERISLILSAVFAHAIARALLWSLEDK